MDIATITALITALMPLHLGYGNLLSQRDLDQGDTAQRVGTLFALLEMSGYQDISQHPSMLKSYALLAGGYNSSILNGIYRRSPNPQYWGSNPKNLTRDQLSVLKIGMVANNKPGWLWAVLKQHISRFGFHQNTEYGTDRVGTKIPDILTPGEISVYCRGLLGKYSVIPNSILDLSLFIDLMLRDDNNWDVDNMLALNLLLANYKYPTIWSKLAMKLYLKTNFMDRLYNYHKDTINNGCEPLYWLFKLAFIKQGWIK